MDWWHALKEATAGGIPAAAAGAVPVANDRTPPRSGAGELRRFFFVCCLYSVDAKKICKGSLSRDKFLF